MSESYLFAKSGNNNTSNPIYGITRQRMLLLLQTALATGAVRFARQAALSWRASYPGDLPVGLIYAQSLLAAGLNSEAVDVLEGLCQTDPEYLEAQQLLMEAQRLSEAGSEAQTRGAVAALGGEPGRGLLVPEWAAPLWAARQALVRDDLAVAEEQTHQALLVGALNPLMAVTHLRVSCRRGLPALALRDLARHYHQRFPNCLAASLYLAKTLVTGGGAGEAVALMHRSVSRDVTGQVIGRLWGGNHPYRDLWPTELEAPFDLPIPAKVATALGLNKLPAVTRPASQPQPLPTEEAVMAALEEAEEQPISGGTLRPPTGKAKSESEPPRTSVSPRPSAPVAATEPGYAQQPPMSETLRSVQAELERVATRLQKRHLARTDGRFPVYVVMTTRQGLEKHYSAQMPFLEAAMKRLVNTINAEQDWDALLFIADDPTCMEALGLRAVPADDPWKLKMALADLDSVLGQHGEMIGALLIVGGPRVVPFHHLPNPVDDTDPDVPSDNPYATRDENYFVPEWPVGRFPGGMNANVLLRLLEDATARHLEAVRSQPWPVRILQRLKAWLFPPARRLRPSLGFTAAIWRRASSSVFRPIGEPHNLLVSPPVQSDGRPGKTLPKNFPLPTRMGYFNLHGLRDAVEWYGQRDPAEPSDDPDYPVALRPRDIPTGDRAPQIVFSEACYGAYILDKKIDDALSLKFLASGSLAVVGSTTTSYGSIAAPLIAADLLGNAFWRFLRQGLPTGEALRQSKIHLAREMHRRQEYLDGEDQKTLISFVLYGDPLARVADLRPAPKSVLRPLDQPEGSKIVYSKNVPVISILGSEVSATSETDLSAESGIALETLSNVKNAVEKYLPGMADADMAFGYEQAEPKGEPAAATRPGRKVGAYFPLRRNVVTLRKRVVGKDHVHWHHARLTLDEHGKVIKMAVSR